MSLNWVLLALLLFALPAPSLGRGVTAVEKVIQLLQKLDKQVSEDGVQEATEYDKFACFCKEQADDKQYQIEKSTDKIASLAASITKLTTEITALDADVVTLGTRITAIEGEVDTEEDTRKTEFDAYVIADKNVTEAIEQVQMAIKAIKEQKGKMGKGTKLDGKQALAQVAKLAFLSVPTAGHHAEVLASLLEDSAPGDPAAYKFRSNDIIATLQWLEKTFKENKESLYVEEFKAKSASEKKVLALTNEKKFKGEEKIEKEELSAEKGEEKSTLEQEKTQEEKDKQSDTDFRDELSTQCQDKAKEWDQRSTSRAAELTAMSEAIGILKSGVASNYGANKKLVGLTAKGVAVHRLRGSSKGATGSVPSRPSAVTRWSPVTLLQVRGAARSQLAGIQKVVAALAQSADELKSPTLLVLRAKVEMQADHFGKVRGLIKDLIAKLESEATDEATQKGLCDTEMTSATGKRDTEAGNIEEHTATIASKETKKAELKQEIADLSKEIAGLNKALKEATELRLEEKKNNERTIKEAADGKKAVEEAISVLDKYYAFAQIGTPAPKSDRDGSTVGDLAPETSFSGDYKGNVDGSKGVIGLLNVILSDFERTGTAVDGQETAAASAHDTFKTTTEGTITTKSDLVTTKEGEVDTVEGEIVTAKDSLETAGGLHKTALKELEKLKAMCIDGEESYAERKKKRQQEIEALKQAMQILEDWKS